MSAIVDKWVEACLNQPKIGSMTHSERVIAALEMREPDIVPVGIATDQWQIMQYGYDFFEVWDDPEKCADAAMHCFHDLRQDVIWPYFCPSHVLDPLFTPEQRKTAYDLRDGRSYVVYKEVTTDLDEMIKVYESKPWEKHGIGRLNHYLESFNLVLEFCQKMGNTIQPVLGLTNPSNYAEWAVGVERFLLWSVTEEKEKIHYYMQLILDYCLNSLEACRPYAEAGVDLVCVFGGSRTWGPKQFDEFGIYDRIFAEQVAKMFKYPFHHICGQNLPMALDLLSTYPGAGVQYDECMKQIGWEWDKWTEWVAREYQGIKCSMNAPTTQALAYKSPEENRKMVKDFIEHTTPYTTAIIMPGCQLGIQTPKENVLAAIDACREYGVYPDCKTAADQIFTKEEFEETRRKYCRGGVPQWARSFQRVPR